VLTGEIGLARESRLPGPMQTHRETRSLEQTLEKALNLRR
jgi:hypothetical protein